jgi:two-component system chemotaxis response regulator CheY
MPDAKSQKVLIVDDAALVRLYYRDALSGAGYQVEEAANGLEALEKMLASPADVIVVDINMPTMDGLTFLGNLRRQTLPVGGTPALVTSSESGKQDFEAARRAGANHYMVKPITPEALLNCVAMFAGIAS